MKAVIFHRSTKKQRYSIPRDYKSQYISTSHVVTLVPYDLKIFKKKDRTNFHLYSHGNLRSLSIF